MSSGLDMLCCICVACGIPCCLILSSKFWAEDIDLSIISIWIALDTKVNKLDWQGGEYKILGHGHLKVAQWRKSPRS